MTYNDAAWEPGARSFVEYRRFGTIGRGIASFEHLRIVEPGAGRATGWHLHRLDLQFVFVLRGHLDMEAHGMAPRRFGPGEGVLIPGGTVHNELGFSDDYEVLIVVAPRDYATELADPVSADIQPDRPVEIFSIALDAAECPDADGRDGWRDLCVARGGETTMTVKAWSGTARTPPHRAPDASDFLFVVDGAGQLENGSSSAQLAAMDAIALATDDTASVAADDVLHMLSISVR